MAFNKQSFLASKEAKSLTSEEIQQEIDYQESIKGNFPDAPTPTNAGPTEAFKQVTATNEAESKAAYDKAGSKGVNVGGLNIPDWLLPPAAIATTGAVGYGLYKLGQRSNKASKIPPAPELTPHQQQLNELELQHKRSQIAHIDAKTQKVLQVKPTATPTAAAPPANIAPQPVAPTQAPAAPSFGKGTDMPLNPAAPITQVPEEIAPLIGKVDQTTAAMAEVATGKPAVPPTSSDPRGAFLQKVQEIQKQAVIPPAENLRRTSEQVAAAKSEMALNKGVNQVANSVGANRPNITEDAFREARNAAINEVYGGEAPTSQGGAVKNQKQLANWIETNKERFPAVWQNYQSIKDKFPTQGGGVSLGMLFNLMGLGGLAVEGMKASKTGDWADFGINAINQGVANIAPKASLPTALMTYAKPAGESPEDLKALGERLKKAQQAYKYGAGRGSMGVPPP